MMNTNPWLIAQVSSNITASQVRNGSRTIKGRTLTLSNVKGIHSRILHTNTKDAQILVWTKRHNTKCVSIEEAYNIADTYTEPASLMSFETQCNHKKYYGKRTTHKRNRNHRAYLRNGQIKSEYDLDYPQLSRASNRDGIRTKAINPWDKLNRKTSGNGWKDNSKRKKQWK